MSLVHKDAHVVTSGYTSKARPWFFGVADPGTGKSHSVDPCLAMVEEVCAECTERVGQPELNYHVVRTRTYAGFEDVVRATGGYGLIFTGEGSCWLAKAWPLKGVFEDGQGLPFDRLMDAADGKGFMSDTKKDRDNIR